jgi:hypothetical protein
MATTLAGARRADAAPPSAEAAAPAAVGEQQPVRLLFAALLLVLLLASLDQTIVATAISLRNFANFNATTRRGQSCV